MSLANGSSQDLGLVDKKQTQRSEACIFIPNPRRIAGSAGEPALPWRESSCGASAMSYFATATASSSFTLKRRETPSAPIVTP